MPHPDKARRQQVENCVPFFAILYWLVLGLSLSGGAFPQRSLAETGSLKEVRVGDHGAYIRVVFELSTSVQYEFSQNDDTRTVSIRFMDTTSQVPDKPVTIATACIDTVSTRQDDSDTVATLSFDPKWHKLQPFIIQEPDRMVLDVFCEEDIAEAKPPAPAEDSQPEPLEPAADIGKTVPDQSDAATGPVTETPQPPPAAVVENVEKTEAPVQNPGRGTDKKDAFQRYLLLLLAAITGIIVFLIALILLQKKSMDDNQSTRGPGASHRSDEAMRAIDTEIKAKLMKYDE